jgi:alpha-N-arabinofuranosidase
VITVHEGIYRERVNPPRGGESDAKRIVYQAASGEKVEIKGSEVVKNWVKVQDDLWKVTLPNSFFGAFNPYKDLIHGDWFDRRGRDHHTGAVYLNGDWLTEAAKLDDVQKPVGDTPLWFGQVDAENTTLWAQFKGVNPNEQRVEINVRQTVFYPDQPGRNYITVRGFALRHAATPWAPPTAEQIGLIGTHWSKGWIIENNTVSHSVCSGIALGKHGDKFDNTSADTAEGYVLTIERAYKEHQWNRDTIGHHIVRNNTISHCEQTGIVGSLGAAFSTVTGNRIHDIHVRQLFSGAEMAGIKFHAAIDTKSATTTSTAPAGAVARLDGAGHARLAQCVPRQRRRGSFRRGQPRPLRGGQQPAPVGAVGTDGFARGCVRPQPVCRRRPGDSVRCAPDAVPEAPLDRSGGVARQFLWRRSVL